jgi:outer membrane lipoprotein-sorting protein
MKKLATFFLLGMLNLSLAQTNADEVISKIIDNQRGGQNSRSTVSMTVIKPDKETKYVISSVGNGDDSSLIQVLEPAKDAGQAFLTVGDNLWIYNPRLKRTLRLPPSGRSDSFLGSDISYNDLGGRDLQTDYTASITEETAETITLELIPGKLAPTPYGKVIIQADASTYSPKEYIFFDQRDQAVRSIRFDKFVEADGYYFPTHIEVKNLLKEGELTVVEFSNYEFGIDIPESCFSQQALERGCL